MELISDPLFDPDEVETLQIGGQICIPPEAPAYWDSLGNHSVTGLPWDTHGFGQDSLYSKVPPYPGYDEGDPYDPNYDPNGFNFEGIHAVTGTLYNEFGCSQAGIDTSGMPCNPVGTGPYYWLNNNPTGPPTLEGIEFANEVQDTLEDLVLELLGIMGLTMEDTLSTQRESCDAIRSNMDGLLNDLDYNRDFIYGPEDEYYLEGMSENFSSRPKPFEVDMDRDPNTIALENKHIDLYDCDTKIIVYLNILELIDQLDGSPDLDDFITLLLEKIKRFTTTQVSQYESMEALKDWLEAEILIQLDQDYREEYGSIIGMNEIRQSNLWSDESEPYLNMSSYASIDNFWSESDDFHPLSVAKSNPYSSINKFRNGDLWIDGVHRTQILETLADNKASMTTLGGQSFMPVEISKEILGFEYTILIDRILLTPSGGEVDVFMVIQDPKTGQGLVFQSLGLEFSPNGIVGNSNLSLASEVPIRLSNAARLIIHGTPGTYVSWDCSGFTGMGVDASVEFCRSFLTPLDTITLEPLPVSDTTKVTAHFIVDVPVWGEFIAELSITPFAVTEYEDIRWVVDEAILDFSEIESRDIEFPENYTSPFVSNGVASNEWKGFYIKELSATFSPKMAKDTADITIGVHDAIFDDRGFTGYVYTTSNLVSLDKGSLAGWPFSIDSLEIGFVANHLMGGSMKGLINVPIFESATDTSSAITPKDCFSYSAELRVGGGFSFVVSTDNNALKAPLFKGTELTLEKNSSVSVFLSNDDFIAKAHLNGKISISSLSESSVGVEFSEIAFKGLEIANVAPYFSPGIWSLPGGGSKPIEIGGFSVSVREY